MTVTKKTFCSICSAFCGFEASVEDNRIVKFQPDPQHPMSKGFSCSKGRHFHELLSSQHRLTHCQKKTVNGWDRIDKAQALDEVADKIRAIVEKHGPEAVAAYCGNGVTFKALTMPTVHAFLNALGSQQVYSSLTIDQPAKVFSIGRHGIWAAGGHSFETANVLMLIGNNPLVSGLHGIGSIPGWQPGALKQAKARGLKLIVIDPRRTETAQQADLHLPIKPGTDAILLSGIIHWIVANDQHDSDFCDRFTEGLDGLAEQVASYSLEKTARLTGLTATVIEQAARLFVSQGRGTVSSATGPDMAPHANLTEHLIYSLNTLCGRHNRAGDKVNTSLLTPEFPPMEAVVPWDFLPPILNPTSNTKRSRVRGAQQLFQEMPTATLAEEILTPGDGQIRALFVVGGNPAFSIPDQIETHRALQDLDLLVCIDTRETATTDFADYLLPASYGLERVEMTSFNDRFWGEPYHQVSQPVVDAPEDAQSEYDYFVALAKRLAVTLSYDGGELNPHQPLDELGALALLYAEGAIKVPVEDIAAHPTGKIYEQHANVEVIPALEGLNDKLQFFPDGVREEFSQLADADHKELGAGEFLLICRRNPHIYNSMCHEFPMAPDNNPAWVHSQDIASLGLVAGQAVTVRSRSGAVQTTLAADDSLRRGVISMTHGFGGETGAPLAALLTTRDSTDRYTHMPHMSAVPVKLSAAEEH